jgi:hypothetical protein
LLRGGEPEPENPLIEIRRRRDARLLVMQAGGDWRAVQ